MTNIDTEPEIPDNNQPPPCHLNKFVITKKDILDQLDLMVSILEFKKRLLALFPNYSLNYLRCLFRLHRLHHCYGNMHMLILFSKEKVVHIQLLKIVQFMLLELCERLWKRLLFSFSGFLYSCDFTFFPNTCIIK